MKMLHSLTKKIVASLLAIVLFATMVAVPMPAKAKTLEPLTVSHVNPLYADVVDIQPLLQAEPLAAAVDTYYSLEGAGAYVREYMKMRTSSVAVGYKVSGTSHSNEQMKSYARLIFDEAVKHTGVPTEGDYLLWHYAGYNCNISGYVQGGYTYLTYSYVMQYRSSAAQEQQLDAAVSTLLTQLNVNNATDYQKVRAVYDYICENISYDTPGLEAGDPDVYTAYAALVKKKAVCQGYASLFYRLSLSLGVDARLIAGLGGGGRHGWNIVKLDGKYYNLDSTWDAGRSKYGYFLKCEATFDRHTRDDEYNTAAFHAAYPMSTSDYVATCATHSFAWIIDTAATCGTAGKKHEECSVCHTKRNENTVIPATGTHTYEWIIDAVATCSANGKKHEECSTCHTTRNVGTVIPSTGAHAYQWITDTDATCGKDGVKHEECIGCHTKRNIGTLIPATEAHTYEWVIDTAATCGDEGVKHEECSVCHTKRSENTAIPATGDHRYDDENDLICNVCLKQTHEPHTHTYDTWWDEGCNNCSYTRTVKKTGECYWKVEGTTLTIGGNGAMGNYGYNDNLAPWGKSIKKVVIEEGVTSVGECAFFTCSPLNSVTLPRSVTSIGHLAFYNCYSLKTITLSANVVELGTRVFNACYALTAITVEEDNPYYCSVDGVLFDKNMTNLMQYPAGKTTTAYEVPDGVKNIAVWAFSYATKLTSVVVGDSVQSIGKYAFAYCVELQNVTIGNGVSDMASYTFYNCKALQTATIGNAVKTIGEVTFANCETLETVYLGEAVTAIGDNAFNGCGALKDVWHAGAEGAVSDIGAGNEVLALANWHYALKNGWVLKDGKWYFYENSKKVVNAWRKDSKGWVYLGADGAMYTNKWVKDSKGWCYTGANGYIVCSKWVLSSGKWYYLDANGYMVTNKWSKDSKGWVYCGSEGYMLTNAWCKDSKGWCYVGADGYAVTNTWKKDSKGWIYLDANGSMTKSAWVKTGGKWYYCDANGYMVASKTITISGKKYTFNASGVWVA